MKLAVYTTVYAASGSLQAVFDGLFYPEFEDDRLRRQEPAFPPSFRNYKFSVEEDNALWFHTEVSNIGLLCQRDGHKTMLILFLKEPTL